MPTESNPIVIHLREGRVVAVVAGQPVSVLVAERDPVDGDPLPGWGPCRVYPVAEVAVDSNRLAVIRRLVGEVVP